MLFLVFIASIATTVYAVSVTRQISIVGISQSTDWWCWAASAQSIIDYLNPGRVTQGQYQIVYQVKDSVFYDSRDAASDSNITSSLTTFGFSTTYDAKPETFSTIKVIFKWLDQWK